MLTTLEDVKSRAAAQQRVLIRPKVVVQARTAAERREVVDTARRVIERHYDVLAALKNR